MSSSQLSSTGELSWELIDRYYAGDVTPEDRAQIELYCRTHPAQAKILDEFASRIRRPGGADLSAHQALRAELPGEVWNRIQQAIGERGAMSSGAIPVVGREYRGAGRVRVLQYAARWSRAGLWVFPVLVVCLIAAGFAGMLPSFSSSAGLATGDTSHPELRRLSTAKGQRASIELGDGTTITLGVASTLTVPSDFGDRDRTLILDGEALFVVAPNTGKPFIVRTATSSTRVLGTSFTVRQYANEQAAITTVLDGKVSVAGTVLTAGQRGIAATGHDVMVQPVVQGTAAGWVDGQITFAKVSLQDVIAELNRWYEEEFVLDDSSLATELVTLNFANRSAAEVAAVLNDILGTRSRRIGTRIVLAR